MRVPVFAANWKMYKTVHDAVAFVREFSVLAKTLNRAEMKRANRILTSSYATEYKAFIL